MIQVALIMHGLPKKLMSYSIFYKVIKNHAKLLDYNALLLKQSQQYVNKIARDKRKQNNHPQLSNVNNNN